MSKKKDLESRVHREIIVNKWPVRFNRKPFDEWSLLAFVLEVNDELTLVNESTTIQGQQDFMFSET